VWAVFIIDRPPLSCEFPHFLQTAKQIEVEHLIPVRAVESFDEGILRGTSRLNVIDENPIGFSPVLQTPC